jgi:hypothetical protein
MEPVEAPGFYRADFNPADSARKRVVLKALRKNAK